MDKRTTIVALLIVVSIVAGVCALYFMGVFKLTVPGIGSTEEESIPVIAYTCSEGKSLLARLEKGTTTLILSDGRTIPIVVGAEGGVRFVGTGSSMIVFENEVATYENCVSGVIGLDTAERTFTDVAGTFRFNYLPAFSLVAADANTKPGMNWMRQAAAPGMRLAVVDVPQTFESKTDFKYAQFTVGASGVAEATSTCLSEKGESVVIHDVTFMKSISEASDNSGTQETTSYRALRDGTCYVLEYTIATIDIKNFPSEIGLKEFDAARVEAALEAMVQSFTFLNTQGEM